MELRIVFRVWCCDRYDSGANVAKHREGRPARTVEVFDDFNRYHGAMPAHPGVTIGDQSVNEPYTTTLLAGQASVEAPFSLERGKSAFEVTAGLALVSRLGN